MELSLITLSNEAFQASRARLVASARANGLENIFSYDISEFRDDPFFLLHKNIFCQPRGMGYWLWKPFLISKTLRETARDSIVVYMDSGIEIIGDLEPLISICCAHNPILLFGNGTDTNARWTKRDAFVFMDCDSLAYWNGPHCDASVIVVKNCPSVTRFVEEWLSFCCEAAVLTDTQNICGLPNLPTYEDHRHDQSVLSLLAQRHEISLHRSASQFGNHFKVYPLRITGEFNCASQWDQTQINFYAPLPYHNSPYGQLLNHHRTKLAPPVPPSMPDDSLAARAKNKFGRIFSRYKL